jgi:hypothetical protein
MSRRKREFHRGERQERGKILASERTRKGKREARYPFTERSPARTKECRIKDEVKNSREWA